MKYNYVFVTSNMENMAVMYSDFNKIQNGQLLLIDRKHYKNSFLDKLLISTKLPFHQMRRFLHDIKKYIYVYKNKKDIFGAIRNFEGDKSICFIIYARDFEFFGRFFVNIIKKMFPESKFVCYFGDVCSSFNLGMNVFRKKFEKLFSFNLSDCDTEGLVYIHEPFSNYSFEEQLPIKYDITFVGAAKDRLEQILNVYKFAEKKDLKLDFHIVGVNEEDKYKPEDISYNKPLKYKEVLRKVVQSKCIFEVMQENSLSPTTRYSEAVVFKKYLITNCKYFKNLKECPNNIIYFENINDIDWERINRPVNIDNSVYLEELRIANYIDVIDKSL